MNSIKDIRHNPELFKNGLSKRFVDADVKKILSLDFGSKKKRDCFTPINEIFTIFFAGHRISKAIKR